VLLFILAFSFCITQMAVAQSVQHSPVDEATTAASTVIASADDPQKAAQTNGQISGTIVDQAGALAAGAQVQLVRPGQTQSQPQ